MRNKTKYLVAILFMLVAFLLLGATNVNAEEVFATVDSFDALVTKLNDDSTTTIKLDNDITFNYEYDKSATLVISKTIDLNGFTMSFENPTYKLIFNRSASVDVKFIDTSTGNTGLIKSGNRETSFFESYYDESSSYTMSFVFENLNVEAEFDEGPAYLLGGTSNKANVSCVTFKNCSIAGLYDIIDTRITEKVTFENVIKTGTSLWKNTYLLYTSDYTAKDVISKTDEIAYQALLGEEGVGWTAANDDTLLKDINTYYGAIKVRSKTGFKVYDLIFNTNYGYTAIPSSFINIENVNNEELKVSKVTINNPNFEIVTQKEGDVTVAGNTTDITSFMLKAKSGLSAGTYLGVIRVYDENNNVYLANVSLTVNKVNPDVTVPNDLTGVYKSSLKTVTLPTDSNGTWTWDNGDERLDTLGEQKYSVTYTPNNTNYNTIQKEVTVTVKPITARTVTVTTEAELKDAISGNYSDIGTIKLGADISMSEDVSLYISDTPFTFDLAGYELNVTGGFYIYLGTDRFTSYNNSSFTFKDSSAGNLGKLIVTKNIFVGSQNTNDASETQTHNFTIDGGIYTSIYGAYNGLFELFTSDYYNAGRNITANITVKKGTFICKNPYLFTTATDSNANITMNLKLDTLQFNNSNGGKLGTNKLSSMKFEDVVPSDSKIYYTNTEVQTGGGYVLAEKELTDRTTKISDLGLSKYDGAYIKIVKDEGFDVENVTLDDLTYDYTSTTSKNISIKNRGKKALSIKTVASSNTNFVVEGPSIAPSIATGDTDTSYSIKAKDGLTAGTYTGDITVTDENNKTYTSTVTIKVKPKTLTGYSVTMEDWTYGDSAKSPVVNGLTELGAGDYEITYAKKGTTEFSSTKLTKAGDYIVKIHVTNTNYTADDVTDEFTINKNAKKIEIKANSNSWVYDGNDHTDSGYKVYYDDTEVTGGTLSTGDIVSATVTGSVKDVIDTSAGNNVITYTLENSDCYSNIVVTNGTLTITPIATPLVVTVNSKTKVYDGAPLTEFMYTDTNHVVLYEAGDIIIADVTSSQIYVGTSDIAISNVKVMRGTKDVSANYTFGTHVNGTLTVKAASQNLSIADQYVRVNGSITLDELKNAVNGAKGTVFFSIESGSGLTFDITNSRYNAGSNESTITMNATASAKDVNGDGTPEYQEASKNFNINIVNKEEVTISGISDYQEFTYDGKSKAPSERIIITDNKVDPSDLEVMYNGTGSTNYNSTYAPINAGTYTVTYKVKDSNPDYIGSSTYNFTIKKAKFEKVTIENSTFEYTGVLINTIPVNFYPDNMTVSGDTSATNVNNYSIVVSINDKDNYEWLDGSNSDITLNWSITKATPSYTVPGNLTSVKGKTLNDVTLTDGFTWNTPTNVLIAGNHTYKATYTPEDTDNYKTITDVDITVDVKDLFNLTNSVDGANGTITESKTNVIEGSKIEVTFTPNTGYMIDKVLVNGTETTVTDNKLELTMNENKDVKVSYKKIPFTVTVEEVTGATVDPNGTVIVNYGDNKDYTITANTGYKLVKVLVNDIEETLDGNTLKLTNITSNMNIKVVVEKIVYKIIEGAEQTYTITENTEVEFKIDANYRLFNNKVYVDNILVNDSNYTSESGSTIITFNKDYVDTLSVGEHILKVAFADGGEATTTFTVNKKSEEIIDNNEEEKNEDKKDNSSNPKTGDNIMHYVVTAGIAMLGLGATVVIKKKQNKIK